MTTAELENRVALLEAVIIAHSQFINALVMSLNPPDPKGLLSDYVAEQVLRPQATGEPPPAVK